MKKQVLTLSMMTVIFWMAFMNSSCSKKQSPEKPDYPVLSKKLAEDNQLYRFFMINKEVSSDIHSFFIKNNLSTEKIQTFYGAIEKIDVFGTNTGVRNSLSNAGYAESDLLVSKIAGLYRLRDEIKKRHRLHQYKEAALTPVMKTVFRQFATSPLREPLFSVESGSSSCTDKCYSRRIEDVSSCDTDAAVNSGLAMFGFFGGFVGFIIAEATVFYTHSRCVDRATTDYNRCIEDCKMYY